MIKLKRLGVAARMSTRSGWLWTVVFVAACGNHSQGDDMATSDLSAGRYDMAFPPADMARCNPADPNCSPPDMAKASSDLGPWPADMAEASLYLSLPPPPPSDLAGFPSDMPAAPEDLSLPPPPPSDMGRSSSDMGRPSSDMGASSADMAAGGDMGIAATGAIGDPCTSDSDCKEGTKPSCWKKYVLNVSLNAPMPGGYCSSPCTVDTDCGSDGSCVTFNPAGTYCLKKCSDAVTCRHPGYACGFNGPAGVCYSDVGFDCDPKTGTGTCTESGTMKAGGCLRGAYEDKGLCSASCTVGTGTCGVGPAGETRQCIYLDTNNDGFMDAFKGLICLDSFPTPLSTGTACTYLNQCVDGDECDPVDNTCHVLCIKGGMPGCGSGMSCDDDLMTPTSGPGLCG